MDQSTSAERLIEVVRQLSSARERSDVTAIVCKAARALTSGDGVTFVLPEAAHCYYANEDAIAPPWKGKRFPIHLRVGLGDAPQGARDHPGHSKVRVVKVITNGTIRRG